MSLIVLGAPGTTFASPERSGLFDSALATMPGTPVASLPNVSSIQHWAAEDSFNVLIQVEPSDLSPLGVYRLTFSEACYNLRWASNVGLSGSQDQVWAGFDYLTADGQRCSISTINRL